MRSNLTLTFVLLFCACLARIPAFSSEARSNLDRRLATAADPEKSSIPRLNPQKTWLFAIGILTFSNNASWGSKNRRDTQIVSLFRNRGVPERQICYIADRNGTLANIKASLIPFLEGSQKGDFLIHYYTGHGGDGIFETTNGGSYKHSWISKQISSNFRGNQVLLLGDCCNSGSLQDVVKNADGSIAIACLSSSSRDESGNGRWTFSQAVLDGLRGQPYVDRDHDGYITIDEIAAHVKHDILVYEDNHSVYRKTPKFNGDMVVAKAKSTNVHEPEPVSVLYHSKWWPAKLMERRGNKGRIRWIQLGYDSPEQDVWVNSNSIRPLSRSK